VCRPRSSSRPHTDCISLLLLYASSESKDVLLICWMKYLMKVMTCFLLVFFLISTHISEGLVSFTLVGSIMIYAIHYKHSFLAVLYALSLSTCVPNMHVSPRLYTLPWTVLCVMCLVYVCLNRWTHTRAHTFIHYFTHTQTRARIHSFFLTLTRGKTMFSNDQILINPKSYEHLHGVCFKKICVCCTLFVWLGR
jgi:hypothetical protein